MKSKPFEQNKPTTKQKEEENFSPSHRQNKTFWLFMAYEKKTKKKRMRKYM